MSSADIIKFVALAGLGVGTACGIVPPEVLAGSTLLQSFAGGATYDLTGAMGSGLHKRFFNKLGEPNHHLNKALQQAIRDALKDIDIEKEFRENYPPGTFDGTRGHVAIEDFFRALHKGKATLILPNADNTSLIGFLENVSEETFEALTKTYPPAAFPNLPPQVSEFVFRRLHAAIAARFWDRVKNDSPTWHAYATEVLGQMRETLDALGKSDETIIRLLEERQKETLALAHPPQEIITFIEARQKELQQTIAFYGEKILSAIETHEQASEKRHEEVMEKLGTIQPAATSLIPHMLPPAADKYFGRTEQKAELEKLLRDRKDACVWGLAGMGKTALAADVLTFLYGKQANALAKEDFPHGIVFLDLYLLKADPEKVWAALANSLVDQDFLKDNPQDQRAAAACANKHCLIIIEGAEEAHGKGDAPSLCDLRSVFCPQNRVLILTRDKTQILPAHTVEISEALDPADAEALLVYHANNPIPDDVREKLLTLLEGHPLALTWAGGLIGQGIEEARDLLVEWTKENLPQINDPEKPQHTLRWLFARNTRGLSAECLRFLHGAGQLARAPFSITALVDFPGITDPAACAKALTGAGILRLAGEEGHREFTHVLGHQFAKPSTEESDEELALHLARWLALELRTILFSPGVDEHLPHLSRLLQHSAALLAANPTLSSLYPSLASGLLYDFAQRLLDLGAIALAKTAITAAADWLEALPDPAFQGFKCQREISVSRGMLGIIAVVQGDLFAAANAYTAAMEIAEELVTRDPENTQWQRDLSISHNKLGDIAVAQGDLPAAKAAYTAGLEIAKTLAARDTENTQWQRDLSISHNKLGDIAVAQSDLPAAKAAYTASLENSEILAARDPENTEWQRDLSVCHDRLGNVAVAQHELSAAANAYIASMEIAEKLAVRDLDNQHWQRDLSVSHNKLGDIAVAQGDLPTAAKAYTAQLEIAGKLAARDPENTQWQRDLFVGFLALSTVAEKRGEEVAARELCRQGHDVLQGIVDKGKHVSPKDMEVLRRLKENLGLE